MNMAHPYNAIQEHQDGGLQIYVMRPRAPFAFRVSEEDAKDIEKFELLIQSPYAKNPRVLIVSGEKKTSLARYILEGISQPPNSGKLFVKHINGDNFDYRRENLAWSTNPRVVKKNVPITQTGKYILRTVQKETGRTLNLYFKTEQEYWDAKKKIANGEDPYSILQTGRMRKPSHWTLAPAGRSVADWALWLRARGKEAHDALSFAHGHRDPLEGEDRILAARLRETEKQLGTDGARLFAEALAEWMDRKAQREELRDVVGDGRALNGRLKNLVFKDPFEGPERFIALPGSLPETINYSELPELAYKGKDIS